MNDVTSAMEQQKDFYQEMHCYPEVIELSKSRWAWGKVLGSCRVRGKAIPFVLGHEECDVCCRSRPLLA